MFILSVVSCTVEYVRKKETEFSLESLISSVGHVEKDKKVGVLAEVEGGTRENREG